MFVNKRYLNCEQTKKQKQAKKKLGTILRALLKIQLEHKRLIVKYREAVKCCLNDFRLLTLRISQLTEECFAKNKKRSFYMDHD